MKRVPSLMFSGLAILLPCLAPGALAQSIKPGTEIKVRLIEKLDTGAAKRDQFFSATLAEPVSLGDKGILARGTRITGRITEAVSSGGLQRPPSITLVLTSIDKTPIRTGTLRLDGKSVAVRNAALTSAGTTGGTIVGAVAEGGKAALIGTAVGTSAGTGTENATGRQEIVLPVETELTFVVADRADTAARSPEPANQRTIEHAAETTPAKWRDESRDENDDAYDALIFSDRDKWVIISYFKSNYGNLPPGLSKRNGDLPPGLEKHLRRDEGLPQDLQQQVEPLPAELSRQLPRLPLGYSRVFLSGHIIIMADDGEIVDMMSIYH